MNDGENKFFIGQRVLYGSVEIVTTIPEPSPTVCSRNGDLRQWVRSVNNIELYVDVANLKPLPRGQL